MQPAVDTAAPQVYAVSAMRHDQQHCEGEEWADACPKVPLWRRSFLWSAEPLVTLAFATLAVASAVLPGVLPGDAPPAGMRAAQVIR